MLKSTNQITNELIFNNNNNIPDEPISLNILHFNDVYNIKSSTIEPKAGAARFLTALKHLKEHSNPIPSLVLFSGDAFSPSSLSLITKGKQMLDCLNKFDINVACIGNHDFDFGIDVLTDLIKETNFSWLISNALDVKTNQPLAGAKTKHILKCLHLKIGLIGLVEQEWIETLPKIGQDEIIYEPFISAAKRLVNELKTKDKVDYVIALTHMRVPNDVKLAMEVEGLNLILGGHDHNYSYQLVNNIWIIKSGTDFRNLSRVELAGKEVVKIEKYTIDSKVIEDKELKEIVDEYSMLDNSYNLDVLAKVNIDLDSRFTVIRLQESNIANLICDILLEFMSNADCCIINSGTFRSDCIIETGSYFTLEDLKNILPFENQIVLLKCTGKVIHETLENSVCTYPNLEGRFPQVAGLSFEFNPSKPPNQRIDPRSIRIRNNSINLNKEYKMLVKTYMHEGKDGFHMLKSCPILIEPNQSPFLFKIVENYFRCKKNFTIEPDVEGRIVVK